MHILFPTFASVILHVVLSCHLSSTHIGLISLKLVSTINRDFFTHNPGSLRQSSRQKHVGVRDSRPVYRFVKDWIPASVLAVPTESSPLDLLGAIA